MPAVSAMVGAVVLAAGQSRRMGEPKLVLPWGGKTIIETVAESLLSAGIQPVVVVTGGDRALVEQALSGMPVHVCSNPDYAQTEMLSSLQVGILEMPKMVDALLVCLGDQPFIDEGTLNRITGRYIEDRPGLVVPSYRMRRGHPWLVDRKYWAEISSLGQDQTLRGFLNAHASEIAYVEVETSGILKDLDTPEDYQREKPG